MPSALYSGLLKDKVNCSTLVIKYIYTEDSSERRPHKKGFSKYQVQSTSNNWLEKKSGGALGRVEFGRRGHRP